MKERPILFSAPMVRALLDGRKTQTRRMMKPQPRVDARGRLIWNWGKHSGSTDQSADGAYSWIRHCPYGAPGDQLWVRETMRKKPLPNILTGEPTNARCCAYFDGEFARDEHGFDFAWTWKRDVLPAIHMPRAFSRITLAVESVRVERLHDITEEDARAEGAPVRSSNPGVIPLSFKGGFEYLWHEINGAESWTANPWVWVIGFSRVLS